MNTTSPNEAPLIIRKRFQVVVEVEVKVAEMPRTPEETRLFGRIAYEGKGVQKILDAENALLNETLNNPQALRVWLGFHALCATGLETHLVEDSRNGDAFLERVIEKLPLEQQEVLARSVREALYHAVEAHIQSVRVEENTDEQVNTSG